MKVSLGFGEFFQDQQHFKGQIVMDENKIFLSDCETEMAASFVPLDRIEKIAKKRGLLIMNVRLSAAAEYTVSYKMKPNDMNQLIQALVNRCGLKKKFLLNEWTGKVSFNRL